MTAKILFFDIETAPSLAWVWKRFKENVSLDQVEVDGFVMCSAWKWYGKNDVVCVANRPEQPDNDEAVVRATWAALDEADIVVAHYGSRFDAPVMNSRFALYGLGPPSPYKLIDTKEVASKKFKFPSNKLDGLARFFGLGKKIKTDFDLWKGCLHGDEKCWNKMIRYCMSDVRILEKVYKALRPWITSHPNVNLFGDLSRPACPKCGGKKIQWRVHEYKTATQVFAAFQCTSCQGWGRAARSLVPKEVKKNVLSNAG